MPPFFFCGNLFDEYLLRLPLDRECNIKIDDILAAAHRASCNNISYRYPFSFPCLLVYPGMIDFHRSPSAGHDETGLSFRKAIFRNKSVSVSSSTQEHSFSSRMGDRSLDYGIQTV